MGRPKGYDRDDIAERAMHMFWVNGFHGSSTRDLADAMGVNISSLYSEFGSKQGLYEAAIERYEHDMVGHYIGALEEPDASLATLRQVLLQYPESARAQERAPGCLLCNAAIERAPTREASRASTSRYVERITAGVVNALTHERERGAARSEAELTALGHHLSAVLLGLFVMVRAGVDAEILDDAVRLAIEQVDAFAGDGSSSGR